MKLTLPKNVLDALPDPGEDGIIRANAGLKMVGEGEVELVELNDQPVPTSAEKDKPFDEAADEYAGSMSQQLGKI